MGAGCGYGLAVMTSASIRFAHLSDMHVEPPSLEESGQPKASSRSGDGLARALDRVEELSPPARFVITGGDHIMDALERSAEDVARQWALYRETWARHCRKRCYSVVGNHDIFGWMNEGVAQDTPGYGKAMACEMLGLPSPDYAFDVDHEEGWGWRVVVLDNVQRAPAGHFSGYYGGLDAGQIHWLERELKSARAAGGGRPVMVVTHIPIVSVCAQHFFPVYQAADFWQMYDLFVDRDPRQLVEMLSDYHVKLCLSSHIHMVERIEFRGVTFICDGSISGDWWRGPFRGFNPGFGVVDLRQDGTFEHRYLELGLEPPMNTHDHR